MFKQAVLALAFAAFLSSTAHAAEGTLKVAVASMLSPKDTYREYKKVVDYIGSRVGLKVALVQRGSYADTNRLLRESRVDVAFICSGPYVEAKQDFDVELLAAPVVARTSYRSLIIVREGSPYKGLNDLKGKSFAYTDPDSNTGCWLPKYMVFKMGGDPERYFGKLIYTHSHDNSMEAVSRGLVEGAGVDSLIYYFMLEKKYPAVNGLRVIAESEPFGMPPVVVPKGLDPKLKAAVRKALLDMHKDPEGKKILSGLMIERFTVPADSDYDGVRKVADYINKINKRGGAKR